MMKVVSNTGPIIALAKIDQLNLLNKLFSEIIIPQTVHRELMGKFGHEWNVIEKSLREFIQVVDDTPPGDDISPLLMDLDIGERQVVSLGYCYGKGKETLLIIDDKKGRQAAQRLQVPLTGTVGVLLLAKSKRLIKSAYTLLTEIRNSGYWLSDAIIEKAKSDAGEGA